MLVRVLVGAGLFMLGYALGRSTRPSVPSYGQHRSARVSEILAAQNQPAGGAQAAGSRVAQAPDDGSGRDRGAPPSPGR